MCEAKQNLVFDINLLHQTLQRDNAIIEGTYDSLTRDSKINYICNCGNSYYKNFRCMVIRGGAFCDKCSKKNKKTKYVNTLIKKYGVDNPLKSNIVKNKVKETNMEKYGGASPFNSEIVQTKIKKTNIEKYGSENVFSSDAIKTKIKETNLEKYGVSRPSMNKEIYEKIINTNIKKYGVSNAFKLDEFKEKHKKTLIEKYGVTHISQIQGVKEKKVETCKRNYDVDYPLQNKELFEKAQINSKKYKYYKMPSGELRKFQGYENYALDNLLKKYNESEIVTDRVSIPRIEYEYNQKKHYYFPDIYIPSDNMIIEVKSEWIYKKQGDIVNIKGNKCKLDGYNYELWIFNNKGERIETIPEKY